MTRLFYDLETTALEVENARIIQICVYEPESEKSYDTLVNPGESITNSDIHNINDEMVKFCFKIDTAIPIFEKFVNQFENPILIAHNNFRYDKPVLEYEYERCNKKIPEHWKFFDSLPIAQSGVKELPYGNHSLKHLYEHFTNKELIGHHSAINDVKALSEVFTYVMECYKKNSPQLYSCLFDRRCRTSKFYENTANMPVVCIDRVGDHTDKFMFFNNINTVSDLIKIYNSDKKIFDKYLKDTIMVNYEKNRQAIIKSLSQF